MLPIGDVNPRKRFPVMTIFLILLNVIVFVYELTLSDEALDAFFNSAGVVPYLLTQQTSMHALGTLLTSQFLHGGFMHLFGNMLYLWIFGDNVEDKLGRVGFVIFYLLAGVVANLAQVAVDPTSQLPGIGASGAIAGVLGVYLVLYPVNRVRTLILLFFVRYVELPAWLVLGFWFVLQLFDGVASIGTRSQGGVAYFAHVGGFAVGLLVGWLVRGVSRRDADDWPQSWR